MKKKISKVIDLPVNDWGQGLRWSTAFTRHREKYDVYKNNDCYIRFVHEDDGRMLGLLPLTFSQIKDIRQVQSVWEAKKEEFDGEKEGWVPYRILYNEGILRLINHDKDEQGKIRLVEDPFGNGVAHLHDCGEARRKNDMRFYFDVDNLSNTRAIYTAKQNAFSWSDQETAILFIYEVFKYCFINDLDSRVSVNLQKAANAIKSAF